LTVTAAAASKLIVQTQPSSTAIAGVPFAQQPQIRIEDAYGNLRTSDNSTVVTAARSAGSGILQGTLTATAVNGVAPFANLSHNVANTITVSFSSSGLTGATSGNIVVSPAAFSKLQLLVDGETAAPGSATGKTGTPAAQFAGTDVIVTVNAVDAQWNRVSSVTDLVGITSSDSTATLPMNTALVSGTQTMTVLFNTNGSFTITATDLSDGSKTASTSPAITVSPAQFTPATGGSAIAADGATGTFTSLTGPSYSEDIAGEVGTGTISLNAPAGFMFDTGGTAPTVLSAKISGTGNSPVQGSVTSVTSTQITYTVTATSANPTKLTWQNIRVRPTAGTPLASGSLRASGTANVPGLSSNSNLGVLREVAGAASSLVILTQPSATAMAGVPFGQQPVLQVFDQFGNVRNAANGVTNGDTVSAARLAGSGTLQGTTNMASANGIVTFTNLSLNGAGTSTIQFTAGSATEISDPIEVGAGNATRLAFGTQPGNAAVGSTFGTQPVLHTQDDFGNDTTAGLPASLNVTVSLTSGTGPLLGTTTLDIGTAAGNGIAAFSELEIDAAGTSKQLTAVASGLSNAVSSTFTVNAGPAASLAVQTQPPATATAGAAFSPVTVIRVLDAFGNLRTTDNSTVVTATRNAGTASLQGTTSVTAVNGLATFSNLSYTKAETISIAFNSGTLTGVTSSSVTVNPAAASKLTLQTQPSATATAGVAFAQQPAIRIEDAYGNLRSSDNSTVVTAARNAGSGTLQGTLTATAVNGVATFANLSHNVATTINLSFTASGVTSATSPNIVVSPAAFTKLQLLVPGETTSPGSASGKTGTPTARTAGTAFNVTVNAVDAYWNLTTTVTDTVELSSTDINAVLPADAVLINGTNSFSVTFKTAGTQTLTATDIDDGSMTNNTSPSITVNTGAFVKMQLLAPGETAAPGTASGKTGTPSDQTAGIGYTVTVRAVDANWNLVTSAPANTIGITTSDPNDAHPANAALSSGTRTFGVTNKTAGSWTVTANNVTDGTKTSANSTVTVNAGAFTKLQILAPGETAAPGTATGKTGTPITQMASTPFNVTVNAVDANWNVIGTATDTVGITSSDANTSLPPNAALVSGTQTLSVTLRTAGTRTLTASDITDGSKSANTSSSITVSTGNFVKLQLLVPGETAAPGTVTGKTGTPTAQGAGTPFNVTVRSVDADWNLVSSIHTVSLDSSDANATLPSNGALSAGTRTVSVTLRTVGPQTVTASDLTDGSKTPSTSPPITVNVGATSKLVIQTQPSSAATAGEPFVQQPVIRVEDAVGNLVTTDNGRVISATRSAGTGTLQGTVTATTVNGIATFTNLSHNVATTITINFSASGLTGATSGSIVVSPATASQLAFSTQPSGTRTGSPLATQPVVTTQDAYGNTSSVGLAANLNVSLALAAGSGSLLGTTNLDLGTAAGNGTATFTTVECSDAGQNKQITASAAGFADALSAVFPLDGVERATGGTAIPSSTAGGAYTTLTGPVYYEYLNGDAGTGTIILNAPSGFIFDTGGTAPTVRVDRLAGGGTDSKNINAVPTGTSVAVTSRTTTQITFTVTSASSGGVNCSLTWQNIRVRPTATSPLASGNITKTGTSTMAAVTSSSTSFGSLIEYGPASRLSIQTQPSTTATAGVPFAQQPVIRIEDAVGHLLTADNSTVVTAARSAGSGTLQGSTSRTAVNGLVTFTNLSHNVATNITINFTSGSLTSTTSTAIAVSPAAAAQLAFTTQPANGTIGSVLANQPVLRSRDQFGNNSSVGLAGSQPVTVALSAGTGPLLGTTTLDIGTGAGNGIIAFTDLRIDSAGTNKQLTASASGLSNAVSSVFSVARQDQTITFGSLANKTYGDAPFTVSAIASSGLPVSFSIVSGPATISGNLVTITGAGTVTVRASQSGDANWNAAPNVDQSFTVAKKTVTGSITANSKIYDRTTAATIATRTLSGVVGSDNVSLSGGTATFSDRNVGIAKTVTATGLSLSGTAVGNYQLASTSVTTTADITAKGLTVSGVTANNKVYDGTTSATLNLGSAALVGVLSGDTVTLNTASAVGTFADENVGTGKTVTVSGSALSGADAGNYTLTQPVTTANITTKGLTVSGITANNKVYDGTTTATLNLASAALVGVASGDSVTLNTGSAAGVIANANVGTAKSVTVSGLTISGADAANYTLTQPVTTADITTATLTASITANSKTYDGTAAATIATRTLSGVIGTDNVSLVGGTAAFADKYVGNGKTVTATGLSLSGTAAGNYQLASTSASTTAEITARALLVSATGMNKGYDGTTVATVTLSDNRLAGDSLSTSYTSASFADKNVGTAKTVNVSGISVTGADAANYSANTTASTTADITARTLTVSATGVNKVYDGASAATVTLSDDRVAGDSLSASYTSASFADKNVGTAKTVNVSGISVTGADAANYSANTTASATADITAKGLVVSGVIASTKVYDGTVAATISLDGATWTGLVSGDAVALNTNAVAGTFASAAAGTNKLVTVSGLTLEGADAGQYILMQPTTTADITPAALFVAADDKTKVYGEANPPLIASYLGFVNGEDANVLSGSPELSTPVATDTPEGTYPITVTLGSLSATNYTFTLQDGQFTVMGAAPSEASTQIPSGEEALTIAQPATLTGIQVVPNGIKISFTGSAGQTYQIVRASALLNSGTVWTNIGSATTDAAGKGEFTDTYAPPTHSFYRAVSPDPQPAPAR